MHSVKKKALHKFRLEHIHMTEKYLQFAHTHSARDKNFLVRGKRTCDKQSRVCSVHTCISDNWDNRKTVPFF